MRTITGNFIIVMLTLLAARVTAGEWHVTGNLRCGDCHLQHSSEKGQPLPEGAQGYLLRKSSINEVCLSCHDGTDPTAPDVQAPAPMYASTTSRESAAGTLLGPSYQNPNGHSLSLPVTTPLQTVATQITLSCASCHAVHGNSNYCNLLRDPANASADIKVAIDTQVFLQTLPDDPPTSPGSIAAYSRDNIAYAQGMSAWCTSCHDALAINAPAAAPAHFNNHPSDAALNAHGIESHTDATHWTAGVAEGFDGPSGVARVPFQVSEATSFATAREVAATNQVSCMSCHKAHGSAHQKSLLWPYLEGGDNFISGCQQCHNQ